MLWFFKVDIIILKKNPMQKLRIFAHLGGGGGGGHFDELWGVNDHNSINIRASALKSLAFDREPKQSSIVFCHLGKDSRFLFNFFGLKGVKCLTFDNQH